ncbi:MAG: GxxExxY protein [Patescibacteria group bacterium]
MNKILRIKEADKIVLPELSYQVVGAAFDVFNELGWGYTEKDYQGALVEELKSLGLESQREVYIPLEYKAQNIGKYFADFIVDKKILLELKVVQKFGYVHTQQVLTYLRSAGLKLGILLYFTKEGVKYRRILSSSVV